MSLRGVAFGLAGKPVAVGLPEFGLLPCCGLGQIPGLPNPPGGQPTNPAVVDAVLGGLPAEQARAIRAFFARPQKPKAVLDFHKRWTDLAWNTWVGAVRTHEAAVKGVEKATGYTFTEALVTSALLVAGTVGSLFFPPTLPIFATQFAAGVAVAFGAAGAILVRRGIVKKGQRISMEAFLKSEDRTLVEFRRRWDQRFPWKQAFREHVKTLPPGEIVSREVALEATRQVASMALLTNDIVGFLTESQATVRSFESVYADERGMKGVLLDWGTSIEKGVEAIGRTLAAILEAALRGAVAALVGAARGLPWWVWPVGGVVLLGPVVGPVLARRLLRAA